MTLVELYEGETNAYLISHFVVNAPIEEVKDYMNKNYKLSPKETLKYSKIEVCNDFNAVLVHMKGIS